MKKYEFTREKRNEARKHFENLGLSYAVLTKEDVASLANILTEELHSFHSYGGKHAQQRGMEVSKLRVKDIEVSKSGLKYAQIQIDGSYFKRRECITFNEDGFIGFGGSLDVVNIQPILKAFVKWCNYIVDKKQGEGAM